MKLTNKSSFHRQKVKSVTLSSGDEAFLRVISGKERDAWTAWVEQQKAKKEQTPSESIYCTFLVMTICDEEGRRIWADEDAIELNAVSDSKTLAELFSEALAWNCIGETAVDNAKKDSGQTQIAPSGTPSPNTSE